MQKFLLILLAVAPLSAFANNSITLINDTSCVLNGNTPSRTGTPITAYVYINTPNDPKKLIYSNVKVPPDTTVTNAPMGTLTIPPYSPVVYIGVSIPNPSFTTMSQTEGVSGTGYLIQDISPPSCNSFMPCIDTLAYNPCAGMPRKN